MIGTLCPIGNSILLKYRNDCCSQQEEDENDEDSQEETRPLEPLHDSCKYLVSVLGELLDAVEKCR